MSLAVAASDVCLLIHVRLQAISVTSVLTIILRVGLDALPERSLATTAAYNCNSIVTYSVSYWLPWPVEEGDKTSFFCKA